MPGGSLRALLLATLDRMTLASARVLAAPTGRVGRGELAAPPSTGPTDLERRSSVPYENVLFFKEQGAASMAAKKIDPRQPDSTDVEVGRLVRALRMSNGLSQTDLANRTGVTFQQVQKYESGANRISMGRLTNIAKLFRVSVPYLLDGGKEAAGLKSRAKDSADYTEALEMLGRIGAQRLLKAFDAIPAKPASLRESIVDMVEYTAAAAASAKGTHKRAKRK